MFQTPIPTTKIKFCPSSLSFASSLGLNNSGFSKLLSSRIYQQFLRPQMEYGLAITPLTKALVTKKLDQAQNDCIRRIYGAHSVSSTVVMKHLARIPSMQARCDILRFKYLRRIDTLPADSLLSIIINVTNNSPRRLTATSPWLRLSSLPLWSHFQSLDNPPPHKIFLHSHLDKILTTDRCQSTLLRQCRPNRGIDPILRIPMERRLRSRLIRWRLGCLTGGSPKPCTCGQIISKNHITSCLNLHARLSVAPHHEDPLSFTLNRIPLNPTSKTTTRKWRRKWPIITTILLALEQLQHPDHQEPSLPPDDPFLDWLTSIDLKVSSPPRLCRVDNPPLYDPSPCFHTLH